MSWEGGGLVLSAKLLINQHNGTTADANGLSVPVFCYGQSKGKQDSG